MTMRSTIRAAAIGAACAVLMSGPAGAGVAFSDQTTASGLIHTTSVLLDVDNRNMYPGGAVGDFNRDGWPDVFLLGGGGTADALFLNNGDGTFTDHAASWGVALFHRGRGATAGDFNNDGWPDIYITSGGDLSDGDRVGQHRLYRNNGDDTFTNVALASGVNRTSVVHLPATGAAFGDYDLDGDLDLYVVGWDGVDSNRLFRNEGNETFTDVTGSAGVGHHYLGFSPRFVDMDGDRYPELIVAADYQTSHYYINDQDGTFTKSTTSGVNQETNGMGTAIADVNRDGLPDWYVTSIYADGTNLDGNYLYVNQGNHQYTVFPAADGANNGGWGWGTDALDCDHDGHIDLAETNGWMPPEWATENSYLFRNNGDLTFSEAQGGGSGFTHVTQGRSLMLLDYDRDGDMDMVLTGWDEPVALYRNEVSGPNTRWIEIRLDTSGKPGLAPDGYGSRVIATTGVVTQYDWVDGGATFLGRSQPVAHFGVYDAVTADLTVEWSDGTDTVLTGVDTNQIITLSPNIAGAPGVASDQAGPVDEQMRASFDKATGRIDVTYTPSCGSSNHTIYYGDLANLAGYIYSGAACWRGRSGTTSFEPGGLSSAFFVIVGNTGLVEGSYGQDGGGAQRPEDTGTAGCDLPRDLSGTCTP